ncbi:sensor histidine kinase [Cellulomonas hominis]|uniref:sensor histidine kinase n=1 Tax=Cellulomonas hominis TaxID=156981 RepID=UPI0014449A65|nr:HAMP domain-containing sensor histidine kinase [Cellulomonas hominis]NKY09605.1 HAMP domain-containing histidine kinase [Cellulomonas hominis]
MSRAPWRRWGVALRLSVALWAVIVVTVATAGAVAWVIGPGIFHENLLQHNEDASDDATEHAEAAFGTAGSVSLAAALLLALLVSSALSIWIAGRVTRSLQPIVTAAGSVARGVYDRRVPVPGLGAEFDDVATAMNAMSERLEHVDGTRRRLLADLAHEMRTPLATLTVYVDSIEDGLRDPDAATLQVLRDQVDRLSRLAEDVSAVSLAEERRLPLRLADAAPEDLVRAAAAAANPAFATKGVYLQVDAAVRVPAVSVDRDRIGQVLANLLDNALRHSDRGAAVVVRVRAERDAVAIAVHDTGDGIAAEHLSHVFDRFYRADAARDRDHGGSGIGLTVSKAFAEAHDGSLDAASPGTGQGATFTLRLPVRRSRSAAASPR